MHLQPMMRAALLAAYGTPTRTLKRGPGGYIAISGTIRTSGPVQYQAFTRRTVNRLDKAGLVTLDDPAFPTTVALNARGIAEAEQLIAAEKAKAGVA
ncbi:hypothetical protein [Pseudoxanthomonas sp. SGT-18]|uniref:hypothetical protein n=1 Tax=Pseudoxanthomonas sp. SGT-18 TaxID=2493087 RepID=UPI0013DE533B|nr:hypothetical protein [Pseudoxanthomonas sp. SGT-18]